MTDKSILFLSGHYGNGEYSNSICVKNLAEELVKEGHRPYVLAWKSTQSQPDGEVVNGVKVKYINESLLYRLTEDFSNKNGLINKAFFLLIRIIRSLMGVLLYPNIDPFNSRLYFNLSQEIIESEKIDVVIATYSPYDGIAAGIKLKKFFENKIKFVTYHLDLLNSPVNTGVIRKVKLFLNKKALEKEYKWADLILLPLSIERTSNVKVRNVGFPLYLRDKNCVESDVKFDKTAINITYIGSLTKNNRNPTRALALLKSIDKVIGKRILIHVWGFLDEECREIINTHGVFYHGVAENNKTMDILRKSDFLLNISNEVTYRMIPSKIFQYFASKKPILNFVKNEGDVSIPYFSAYSHTLIIYEKEEESINREYLERFIANNYDKDFVVADDLFIESTPQYICNVILNHNYNSYEQGKENS